MLIPPDHLDEEPMILGRIRRGEHVEHYETVRQRKDGSRIDISLTVSPIRDSEGRVIGASKIARDITEKRRAQEQQTLLLREMSHRVKNLFAVAGGLVALSARSARTPQDMAEAVQERLVSLTRAHELTRPGLIGVSDQSDRDTTLHALIQTILAPYAGAALSKCVALNGADVPIGGNAVTSCALVLHELATNAAKYGALSEPEGVVHIDCAVADAALALTWSERGGPAVNGQPDSDGFGGMLTRRIIEFEFRGRLSKEWRPEGLIVQLSLPLARLTA